jgi:NAD(P)-dependent dehydrogenase (short-subunit alcohol dehydrogenase family)
MTRLAGKSALITGAARGIGCHFAKTFVAEGARVALADIDIDRARKAAAEIGDSAMAIEMDVTSQASIDAAVAKTDTSFGGIDILVNNAAVFTAAPIAEISRDDYRNVFEINVVGTLFTMQAVARKMIERGTGGKIINMASQAGRRGEPLVAVYCATKAAVISLTQSAGLNLIGHGINVNAIAPGLIQTDFAKALWDNPDIRRANESKAALKRIGQPDDIAGVAVFLASKAGNFVCGQCIIADGGVIGSGAE